MSTIRCLPMRERLRRILEPLFEVLRGRGAPHSVGLPVRTGSWAACTGSVVCGILLAAAHAPLGAQPSAQPEVVAPPFADEAGSRRILVKFHEGAGRAQREHALSGLAKALHHFEDGNRGPNGRWGPRFFDQLVSAELGDNVGLRQALSRLEANGLVEYVEENGPVSIVETLPSDASFSSLWGLRNTGQTGGTVGADIDAPAAWDITTGSPNVVVAVIDTGIEYTHPDLAGNIWSKPGEIAGNGIDDDGNGFVDDVHGYDFYNGDGDPRDDHFHGTHCAGTIGAVGDNGIGVAGVNWDVSLMALKFLSASGSGYTDKAVEAIQYAINNGAHVLSNSWGGGGYSQALQDAILAARAAGVTFVAAAGNNGSDTPVYPAAYEGVIAVSATDHNDLKAGFSSYGAFVDVAAPGVNIYSTDLGGGYRPASGTSMACPHVAGTAALLRSVNSDLTPNQIEGLLKTTAEDRGAVGWDTHFGAGRINAYQAVGEAISGDLNFPEATVTAPAFGATVSALSVPIIGTASGDGFSAYQVELAPAGTSNWSVVHSSTSPVSNGVLGTWDTTAIPDGNYLIRLVVTDLSGRSLTSAVTVTLDRFDAAIHSPTQLVGQGSVDVMGSAATTPGVPFDSFTLEWGAGSAPSSYSTAGITLAGGGASAVTDGKLATWDTSALSDGQDYTLRLTVRTNGGSAVTTTRVKADGDLVAGWPVPVTSGIRKYVAPVVGDLDGDGSRDMILAGPDDQIRAFDSNGQPLSGFPVTLEDGDAYEWGVNLADLGDLDHPYGDGRLEIVAVARNSGIVPQTRIVVVGNDGKPASGWPAEGIAFAYGYDTSDLTPAIADLNGDGRKELVVVEVTTWVWQTDVTVHAFTLGGGELQGFPRTHTLPSVGFDAGEMFPSKHGVPSVADLDGDGAPEIAWSYSNRVILFDHQGNILTGWPYEAPLYNGKIMLFENAAASGDLDGDGQLELFSAARAQNCGNCETQLYAWSMDGSVLPGWPKSDQQHGIKLTNTVSSQNTPVLVDIDGDGKDEVLAGLGRIYAFDEGGAVPFAVTPITSQTQPAFADVDGDGRLEFSGNNFSSIGIMDDDGSLYWQKTMPSAAIRNDLGLLTDLEGDGAAELVVAYPDASDNLALFVWAIPGAGGGDLEWRMFGGDPTRSGRGGAGGEEPPGADQVAPLCSVDSPNEGSTVADLVTVAVSASDNVRVAAVRLYRDGTQIGFDDSAPFSFPWDTRGVANGPTRLRAEAVDPSGNLGASEVQVTVDNVAPPGPIAAPSGLAATVSGAVVTLTWTDNAANETGFRVERGIKAKGTTDYGVIGTLGSSTGSSVTYTDTVGSEGTYTYRVQAFNPGAVSDYSNEAVVRLNRNAFK